MVVSMASAFNRGIAVAVVSMVLFASLVGYGAEAAQPYAELPWVKPRDTVLPHGEPGSFDEVGQESPVVVKRPDGTFIMYYRGEAADGIHRVGYATSPDGKEGTWTKGGVILEPTEEWEEKKISPMTCLIEDGTYVLFYEGGFGRGIGYATSPDGISGWKRNSKNPVLTPTPKEWDDLGVGECHVVKLDSKYVMIYKGFGSQAPGWAFFGYAESTDMNNWTKLGKVLGPPEDQSEGKDFRAIHIVKHRDWFIAFYSEEKHAQQYMASSFNLKEWVKHGLVFKDGPHAWWATSSYLMIDGGLLKIWYESAGKERGVQIFYAYVDILEIDKILAPLIPWWLIAVLVAIVVGIILIVWWLSQDWKGEKRRREILRRYGAQVLGLVRELQGDCGASKLEITDRAERLGIPRPEAWTTLNILLEENLIFKIGSDHVRARMEAKV